MNNNKDCNWKTYILQVATHSHHCSLPCQFDFHIENVETSITSLNTDFSTVVLSYLRYKYTGKDPTSC
jgi:hypothetical protein